MGGFYLSNFWNISAKHFLQLTGLLLFTSSINAVDLCLDLFPPLNLSPLRDNDLSGRAFQKTPQFHLNSIYLSIRIPLSDFADVQPKIGNAERYFEWGSWQGAIA